MRLSAFSPMVRLNHCVLTDFPMMTLPRLLQMMSGMDRGGATPLAQMQTCDGRSEKGT